MGERIIYYILLEREIIAEEFDNGLPRVVEMIAKEVDDERQREQQQEITAAGLVGRPSRSTDMHSVHRIRRRSTDRSTAVSDCKCPTLCWPPGRPPGRPETDW